MSLARSRKKNILTERVELLRKRQHLAGRLTRLEEEVLIKMGKEELMIKGDNDLAVNLKKKKYLIDKC